MVPDLHNAAGGVVQSQVDAVEQNSEVSSFPQYEGQQTFSTKVQEPQTLGSAGGYAA